METKKYIQRELAEPFKDRLFKGKALILLGPRQAGKTTLVKKVLQQTRKSYLLLNADEPDVRELLNAATSTRLRNIIGQNRICCIDEAQRVPDVGLTLKLFTDEIPEVQVMATGSSSLELNSSISEPLTGRKFEFVLHPLSFRELSGHYGLLQERRCLEHRLVYGAYPEIVTTPENEEELIKLLADSYLFKDLLGLNGLKKPALLEKIVRALAFQVGSEVTFNEIAQLTGASSHTVEKYVDLLEKSYVVFKLPAYSRNRRNEIKKGKKIYFWDNGVRNAVIGNFLPPSSRTDSGVLWENYLVAERAKFLDFSRMSAGKYFWRTTQQQEIDFVQEDGGKLKAFEFKWSPKKAEYKFPSAFVNAYPNAQTSVVTPENYDQFLLEM